MNKIFYFLLNMIIWQTPLFGATKIARLPMQRPNIALVKISPYDTNRLLALNEEGHLVYWNVQQKASYAKHQWVRPKPYFPQLKFSQNGRYVLLLDGTGAAELRDLGTGALVRTFDGSQEVSMRSGLAISPDQKVFATALDRKISIWSIESAVMEKVIPFPENAAQVHALHFSPDGRRMIVHGKASIYFFDIATQQLIREVSMEPVRQSANIELEILSFDISYDLRFFAAVIGQDIENQTFFETRVINSETGRIVAKAETPNAQLVRFSKDAQKLMIFDLSDNVSEFDILASTLKRKDSIFGVNSLMNGYYWGLFDLVADFSIYLRLFVTKTTDINQDNFVDVWQMRN